MSNLNLRNITNSFLDVRLVSLSSWRQAGEISPRDHGGEEAAPVDPKNDEMAATFEAAKSKGAA